MAGTFRPAARPRAVALGALALWLLLSGDARAQEASHRAAAEAAERVGRYRAAARDYAAAFEEEHAPELLYRLGICRRRLKLYGPAREAFRGYLRLAPSGALKDDAERQLAQLDVLLDEERRGTDEAQAQRPRRTRRAPPTTVTPAAPPPSPPAAVPSERAPQEVAKAAQAVEAAPPAVTAPSVEAPQPPAPLVLAAPPPSPAARPLPEPPAAIARPALPLSLAPPAPALELVAEPPSRLRAAAPYVAGATAVACAAAGSYFWIDGARVSRDLDARFATGALTAADEPRYGRAHAESVAGRALVAAAIVGAAAAVLLWR